MNNLKHKLYLIRLPKSISRHLILPSYEKEIGVCVTNCISIAVVSTHPISRLQILLGATQKKVPYGDYSRHYFK